MLNCIKASLHFLSFSVSPLFPLSLFISECLCLSLFLCLSSCLYSTHTLFPTYLVCLDVQYMWTMWRCPCPCSYASMSLPMYVNAWSVHNLHFDAGPLTAFRSFNASFLYHCHSYIPTELFMLLHAFTAFIFMQ